MSNKVWRSTDFGKKNFMIDDENAPEAQWEIIDLMDLLIWINNCNKKIILF